jgi:hypothetical protein
MYDPIACSRLPPSFVSPARRFDGHRAELMQVDQEVV